MIKRILALLVSAMICLAGCKDSEIEAGSFILTKGTYDLANGVSLEIFKDTNDLLNIRHTLSNGNSGEWTEGIIHEDSGWFIYVSNYKELWLATEDDLMVMYESETSSGNNSIFICSQPETLNQKTFSKVPQAVLASISPKLIAKIEKAQAPKLSNN